MKLVKYLVPLWSGILIYALLSIFFGAKGLSAYSQLEAEKTKELINIDILKEINWELSGARDILSNNRDNFYVPARELGFASPGEQFIRIIGLGGPPKTINSPGKVVTPLTPDYISNRNLQIFSVFMTFTILISMGAYDFLRFMKEREAN